MTTQSAQWLAAARLVRRTGFGADGRSIDAALKLGSAAYLNSVLRADPQADPGAKATPPPQFARIAPLGKNATKDQRHQRNEQLRVQLNDLSAWWLHRMCSVTQPFGEKLTFCWHNHFATAATKVRQAPYLLNQNDKLRRMGRGDFPSLALAMLTDAAMLFWLDGQKNTVAAPNENLSREFMELFTLGHGDGYTETDVREGARALTGWRINPDGSTHLRAAQHDHGNKNFLGVSGDLDVGGYCDAILARPAAAGFLATRWWGQLVSDLSPTAAVLISASTAYGANRNLTALFTALLGCPEFAAAQGSLIIDPVEWLVGAVRALKVPVTDTAVKKLLGVLRGLGQVPFYPPNVGGWPSGQAWLSTAAADARMRAASALATAADLSELTTVGTSNRLDALGYLLGVGNWSVQTAAVLKVNIARPEQLVAIALNSPEYLVH